MRSNCAFTLIVQYGLKISPELISPELKICFYMLSIFDGKALRQPTIYKV